MTAAPDHVGEARQDGPGGLPSSSPTSALGRIAVLLRHVDTEIAAVRQEVSSSRRLSVLDDVPDLDRILGPLERALSTAADTFELEPAVLDGRRALRATLNILWADLVDTSPENLHKYWGVVDIPDHWPRLHSQLLAAVETAIAEL
ncbi:MAG TPA: hypothetical protein VMF65_10540 [Acidimicrobiales bacterium]|nr:hypothetical protein [Acidimicrobiales bacterium]